ncbi:MAG: transcriptional repressor [Eubacteriales bacterium]|nr:transcriptional repressor [Eubacteriales bacterium]
MANLKYSRQRESIKQFLASRKDHPTADTIYVNIRREYPHISLGTVYRNLALLTDIGEIIKITAGDGVDRYDYDTSQHHHFICRECHCVKDLAMENIDYIKDAAQQSFHGLIERYSANFYGICDECLEKESLKSEISS